MIIASSASSMHVSSLGVDVIRDTSSSDQSIRFTIFVMDADSTHKRRRRKANTASTTAAPPTEGVDAPPLPTREPTLLKRKRARPSTSTAEPTLPSPPPAPQQQDEKDEEEKALESLLFGGMLHTDQLPFGEEEKEESVERANGETNAASEGDVESLFVIDRKGAPLPSDAAPADSSTAVSAAESGSSVPVWHDPDDEQQMIDLAAQPRLRKLRASDTEQRITAADYQQRLRQTYTSLNHAASWVKAKRATADSQDDGAMWDVLRTSRSIKKRDTTALPSGHLDIQALKDANAQQPAQVRATYTHCSSHTVCRLVWCAVMKQLLYQLSFCRHRSNDDHESCL